MDTALITMATGQYNDFVEKLVKSTPTYFPCKIYLFTDKPEMHDYANVETIKIPSLNWPVLPLLRFECIHHHFDKIKEKNIYVVDVDCIFNKNIDQEPLNDAMSVGTLHRNIMRLRKDFNYETRNLSTACVPSNVGEKYFACGFIGGKREWFKGFCFEMSRCIREDIENNIRALWGDESHINRHFAYSPPELILPPSYMCPRHNPHFKAYIVHQHKQFKSVNKPDAMKYLKVNPKDYEIKW